jgi:hypothetical protein
MKKRKRVMLVSAGLVFSLCLVLFLPGEILTWQSQNDQNVVYSVPEEQYQAAKSMAAKEMSSKLTKKEKKQLLNGTWKSEIVSAEEEEMQLLPYEAVELAREKTGILYKKKKFPVNLADSYQNWFCWHAEPYKAVDAVFHSYAVLFWKITFEKYDSSESYTVEMMEDGTIVTT